MEVYFYGLFMDRSLLLAKGVTPSNPRKGYLDGYALKIGNRASLVPFRKERSYGIVMTVDEDAVHELYAEASVADYIPEDVIVTTETGEEVAAVCYNLPAQKLTGTNAEYARSLYELAEKLGFPSEYLDHIERMCD